MNIWALDRHQDIRHVLLLLAAQLGDGAFMVDAETPADSRAVYLCHPEEPGVRVWLYLLGQSGQRYGVHLEYPQSVEFHEDVSLETLVEMLAVHFDVPVIQPLP